MHKIHALLAMLVIALTAAIILVIGNYHEMQNSGNQAPVVQTDQSTDEASDQEGESQSNTFNPPPPSSGLSAFDHYKDGFKDCNALYKAYIEQFKETIHAELHHTEKGTKTEILEAQLQIVLVFEAANEKIDTRL